MSSYAGKGEKMTVAIIGGGLSGLSCAKYLAGCAGRGRRPEVRP